MAMLAFENDSHLSGKLTWSF